MYRTSTGERILTGKEAEVFQQMIGLLLLDDFDPATIKIVATEPQATPYGIAAYDDMSFGQQLWTLNLVAKALLIESTPSPPQVAYVEATVATIFIMADILIQIDERLQAAAPSPSFVELMKGALAEQGDESCDDLNPRELIEILEERILWYSDYCTLNKKFLDSASESSRQLDEANGGYYTAVAHDPPESQYKTLYEELIELMEV
ncbi:MAG: hypothetical protein COA78_10905 [Blastopirellula sp.]|nr:MAG: hypothetical protein COA78_10905 [Blastopirellula sp.]